MASIPEIPISLESRARVRRAGDRASFDQLTAATSEAAKGAADPVDELLSRCRAYCHFALEHPRLYQLMFQADLPLTSTTDPKGTPGRRSFENLVTAIRRCLDAGLAPAHDDPFRLASLVWTAEHGMVLARISRPAFPRAPLGLLVNDMVTRLMGLEAAAKRLEAPS